ncbi:MAG: glycoside hydrolase family 2 protein [Anaerolineales bacterium]
MLNIPLVSDWEFKERDPALSLAAAFAAGAGWLPAQVPGCVHLDLLRAGRIPDPFYGLNELAVQWVGERDWLYRLGFDLPPAALAEPNLDLCFDGLDTFATVWLNGAEVLAADNMFVPHRLPARQHLRAGRNELWLLFESAVRRGQALEAQYGRRPLWNGDSSRLYVRKAQYHYGWDWGPTLLTAGPWRAIRLEAYTARIADLHVTSDVAPDLQSATITTSVTITGDPASVSHLRLELLDPDGQLVESAALPPTTNAQVFTLNPPRLWYPNGGGPQPLYTVRAILERDGAELHRHDQRLGLRRLRLLREPLEGQPGESFVFEVNNTPIFCGGANWIPADSFTPRLTPADYRRWLTLAAEANMNMLRVWGGGIYEDDAFYDLCDELGLLVWQDFMFACGLYPAHAEFQASVRAEAEANVRRLRGHACLALWAGNNEDYSIADSLRRYNPAVPPDEDTNFPARAIYEQLLPEVCAALDPATPYRPGSPYGGANPNSQLEGDRHTWDVWHGSMAPYQNYPDYAGRFVSEFGMLSLPAAATVEAFTPSAERYPQSRTLEHHNKAGGGVQRVAAYLSNNIRLVTELDDFIYATQFIQAEALASAYRGWRRMWGGPGTRAVAGALVWQLNDCWPVSSWAIVDSALRPKPAYYAIRRELRPLVLGLAPAAGGAAAWAVNDGLAPVTAQLELTVWSLDGAQSSTQQQPVTLPPNQALELGEFALDLSGDKVLAARLLVDGAVAARAALWPEPFKYLALPEPGLELARDGAGDGAGLRLRAARPAKGVWLEAGDGVAWSDNFIDLLPGDEQVILASRLDQREVSVRWLR